MNHDVYQNGRGETVVRFTVPSNLEQEISFWIGENRNFSHSHTRRMSSLRHCSWGHATFCVIVFGDADLVHLILRWSDHFVEAQTHVPEVCMRKFHMRTKDQKKFSHLKADIEEDLTKPCRTCPDGLCKT